MLFVLQLFNRQSSCAGIRVWPCAYTGHIQVQQWVWVNTCFRLYINIHVVWQNMPYTHLYWFQWEWVRLLVCEMADLKRWLKFSLGTGINCRAPRQTRLIILNQFGQVNSKSSLLANIFELDNKNQGNNCMHTQARKTHPQNTLLCDD